MAAPSPRMPWVIMAFCGSLALLSLGFASLFPLGSVAAAPTSQQAAREEPKITVTGEGEVRAEPDLAVVTVGVTHIASTSQEAMDEVNRRLAAVIAGAKALGVDDRDVQTSGLSLQPITRPRPRGDDLPPEIEAYRASNNVSLTVRDLNRAGPVLDSATLNGANVIGGLRFGFSNVDTLRLQALANATANADSKARAIASAAGVSLAGLLSVTEAGISVPRAAADIAVRAAPVAEAAPTPVEPGEMVIRARVQASYRI